MADIAKIVEEVSALTVIELNDLVKAIEVKFGVSAAAPVAAAGGAAVAAAPVEEEKTEFDVIIKSAGASKLNVIKALREIVPGLGLVDAKKMAEEAPKVVKQGADKKTADEIAKKLKDAGAEVEIK
ncbi:MAG: 50S ribosomal protein L7/L12 [Christensenellaceae bacterium]|jgi:large subunit ribosomal protein L7/L12|nr:50S ribosomal protein L7/L12 [Christensenellaceae bacterium]